MRQPRPEGAARVGRFRASTALIAALALGGACQSSATPLPSPSPSQTPTASTAATASPTPAESPTTAPSGGPRWASTGSTSAWRIDPHAVLLSDGRVLLTGTVEINGGTGIATTAEMWDPATGTWTATDGLNKARADFVAVPLADDRVLVAGGLNDASPAASYSSSYVYDARAGQGTWTKSGLMVAARTGPSAAVLRDGRVLVAGGYFHVAPTGSLDVASAITPAAYRGPGGTGSGPSDPGLSDVDPGIAGSALATAELFDPATGTWSSTGALHYARQGAPAVTLADGRVLIAGSSDHTRSGYGVRLDQHAFTTAEIYDPATGAFTLTGGLPKVDRAALEKHGTAGANPMPSDDGRLDLVGSLVAVPDGGAVLVGQTVTWKHVADLTRSFRFDVGTGTWTDIGQTYVVVGEPGLVPLWIPDVPNLAGSLVAPLPDGRVLVAGGRDPIVFDSNGGGTSRTTTSARVFDPSAGTWSALPPMPVARAGGAIVVLADGSALLMNGNDDSGPDAVFLTSAVHFSP
jgi:hypothetical protein